MVCTLAEPPSERFCRALAEPSAILSQLHPKGAGSAIGKKPGQSGRASNIRAKASNASLASRAAASLWSCGVRWVGFIMARGSPVSCEWERGRVSQPPAPDRIVLAMTSMGSGSGKARDGGRPATFSSDNWASRRQRGRPSVLDALDLQHARAGALHVVHRRANRVAE